MSHQDHDDRILAVTIMPDHIHVLLVLGDQQSIGQWVGGLKSNVRRAIRYEESWQRDFWEHRLRPEEDGEDYGLYIFLNPYRAGLIAEHERWPWWWAPESGTFHFTSLLNAGCCPPEEWIHWPDSRFASIHAGE